MPATDTDLDTRLEKRWAEAAAEYDARERLHIEDMRQLERRLKIMQAASAIGLAFGAATLVTYAVLL